MRQLLACQQCARQYDVTGRPPGVRFHCSCGAVLEIKEAAAHDASVVRCSSCGGPRGDAESCSFCGASFTLHERDLDTMCPKCMSRISNKARFCHHCGTVIAAENVGSAETEHDCPACGKEVRLSSRRLGQAALSVLECGRCAGLWVGAETLRHLEEQSKTQSVDVPGTTGVTRAATPKPIARQGGSLYRPCVVCGNLMNRQNYGRRSGVIIDRCADHGVWFDNEELGQILRWIRQGGLDQSQKREAEAANEKVRQLRVQERVEAADTGRDPRYTHDLDHGGDMLSDLGGFLVRSFFN